KAHIRYAEAIAGIEVIGLGESAARFLDMPFYKTGTVRKAPIGEADVQVVLDLLNEARPDHIFVAGDLSDPHGTHRMCYQAIKEALPRYNRGHAPAADGADGRNGQPARGRKRRAAAPPLVWLYRGA